MGDSKAQKWDFALQQNAELKDLVLQYRQELRQALSDAGIRSNPGVSDDWILEQVKRALTSKLAPLTAHVSEIRAGEAYDGPLDSTDLYVSGRGLSLLVNVKAPAVFTYSMTVDDTDRSHGTVGNGTGVGEVTPGAAEKQQKPL